MYKNKKMKANVFYIIPPIPPPAGIAGAGSGISAIAHSVVRNIPNAINEYSLKMVPKLGLFNVIPRVT